MGRDFEIDGLALDDFDGFAAQKTGNHELLNLRRRGHDGGKSGGRIGADRYGNLQARAFQVAHGHLRHAADGTVGNGDRSAGRLRHGCHAGRPGIGIRSGRRCCPQRFAIVLRGYLLPLPVHAGGLAVVDLHAVHADVAPAVAGIARVHARQGDEPAPVMRPALEDGEDIEVEVVAENDLLAAGLFGAHGLWKCAGQRAQLRQHLELVEQARGRLHVHQPPDALGNLVQPLDAESQRHAPLAAKLVDEHLVAGMALHVLKQQRRAAGSIIPCTALRAGTRSSANFRHAVGDFRNFELWRDFFANAFQFAVLFEGPDPVAQIVVGQGFCSRAVRAALNLPA